MSLLAKPILFFLALLVNLALYLAVPFMQTLLHQQALGADRRPKTVERELVFAHSLPEKSMKREIKEIRLEPIRQPVPSGRPALPGGGLKLDLSLAGGEGMALVSGGDRSGPLGSGSGGGQGSGVGAMVYEPGQTDSDARIIGPDPSPKYPPRAEREGVAGYADLLFVVNESGFAEQIAVLKEEPPGYGFAAAAAEAVRRLRFQPALLQKTPVKQKVKRRVNFEP